MSAHSSRGTTWERIREAVLLRDGYRCKRCGRAPGRSNLEVHHIVPKHRGGRDVSENLATACRRCHIELTRMEKNPARAEWEAHLGV